MKPAEVFELFSHRLNHFADAVSHGEFACWVGSGVSRDRVAPLSDLLLKLIEHLRTRGIVDGDARFAKALDKVLSLVALSAHDKAQIDLTKDASTWSIIGVILDQLQRQYASVLDIPVDGEEPDYLLWHAVDVCKVYGDPTIPPDVGHIAIAVLILEGVIPNVVTSNWDGLIEGAVAELTRKESTATLSVAVRAEDLRAQPVGSIIYKFHGCALLACKSPTTHRKPLVARESQISGWVGNKQQNGTMLARLVDIATTRKTLLLGLSAQDSNIKHVFSESQNQMAWKWPDDPSACMLATPDLEDSHRSILQNFYREPYEHGDGPQIEAASVIGTYPKPALLALAINVVFTKLSALLDDILQAYADPEREAMNRGLHALAMLTASGLENGELPNVYTAIKSHYHLASLYLEGSTDDKIRYQPLAGVPAQQITGNQFASTAKIRGLSAALALLGVGQSKGLWAITAPDPNDARSPSLVAKTASGNSFRVFILSCAEAGLQLSQSGRARDDDDDAILIYADILPPFATRAPKTTYGRTGKVKARSFAIAELVNGEPRTDALLQRFRTSAIL